MSTNHSAFTDLSADDQTYHLLVDHQVRPPSLGGDPDEFVNATGNADARLALHQTLHDEDAAPRGPWAVPHQHRPPLHVPAARPDDTGLVMEFDNDAWEFLYGQLSDLAKRQIIVELNGEPHGYQLTQLEGDALDLDPMPYLFAKQWDAEVQDYVRPVAIALFTAASGECAITRVKVL